MKHEARPINRYIKMIPFSKKEDTKILLQKFDVGSRIYSGYGQGTPVSAVGSAFGEFIERKTLFSKNNIEEVDNKNVKLADNNIWSNIIESFNINNNTNNKSINFVSGIDLIRNTVVSIPEYLIALYNADLMQRKIIPIADTNGCAVHMDDESAILKAISEFFERQFLLTVWNYGGRYESKKLEYQDVILLNLSPVFNDYLNNGEIFISKLYTNLDFHVFVAGYKGNDKIRTKFAISAAGDFCASKALIKALVELSSGISLEKDEGVTTFNSNDDNKDFYLRSNKLETILNIHFFFKNRTNNISNWILQKDINLDTLLTQISNRNLNLFLYINKIKSGYLNKLSLVKIISPDFYLNIRTDKFNNINNKFAISNLASLTNTKRLPFP